MRAIKKKMRVFASIFFVLQALSLPSEDTCAHVYASSCLEGKAECVMELQSRRILYAQNSDNPMPMASTTKILTAATVLEYCDNVQEQYTIPKEAVGIEGSSVYLKAGDVYTVEELLYGLLLRSGNDCATALALYTAKTVGEFSVLMNQTAQKAGALHSHFKNPHGLPCKGHVTTAKDLSYITCYAMENALFKKIVSTTFYQPRQWKNKNKLLQLYDGGCGIKTGYTKEAGRCFVGAATQDNMTLVCSLLNCSTTYERSMSLLNDAFAAYHRELLISPEQVFSIENGKEKVACKVKEAFYYPLLPEELALVRIETKALPANKVATSKEIVGQFEIYLSKQLLFSGNLYKL